MGNLFCCVQVDQSKVAIKERFGKFDDVLEPGCHCLPWCLGSQIAGELSLRLQQLDVRCETKTKVPLIFIDFKDDFKISPLSPGKVISINLLGQIYLQFIILCPP